MSTSGEAVQASDAVFLGRCRRCKLGLRIHAPVVEKRERSLGYGRKERVYIRSVDGRRVEGYDRIHVTCPRCPPRTDGGMNSIELRLLRGRLAPKIACSSKCTGATGPTCDCSCAGKNHGASFG